jgi:lipid II:glycine glycyltransferase (peptidoglycan interpeptide bridge formation enzyme)
VRWAVRKAELTPLKVTFEHDLDAVRAFHELVCTTRKRHGLPPQPLRFFENIHRHALSSGKGCVVLARLGSTPIAGSMFLHFGKSAIFKFGASDAAFHHLRPNNLVMWRAIEWHARAGFESLDFGRTSIANKGLRHFKIGWGAAERRIDYARFDRRAAAFVTAADHSSGWHNSVFKMVPRALARVLGTFAYKHVA